MQSFLIRINVVLIGVFLMASPPALAQMSYFLMDEERSENLKPFPKWTGVVSRFAQQQQYDASSCDTVPFYPCAVLSWQTFLRSLKGQSFVAQMDAINDWGNQHPYIIDQINWGISDFWATPHEFIQVNGDCEDYAIAKYYSMRAMGIPAERLRIMVVQDINLGGIIHAILGVYDEEGALWVLDNQIKQVRSAMSIYHYRPIYGTNEHYWWRYMPKN